MISTCFASCAERREPLLSDTLVADPIVSATHAIDIAAPPERVWPWLAQMGAGRAGWYSWDRLDNGGVRSADRLVMKFQRPSVGDVFPAAPGSGDVFVAARVDPPRSLVLGWPARDGQQRVTWEFSLRRSPRGTRLVVRARMDTCALDVAPRSPGGPEPLAARIVSGVLHRLPRPLFRVAGTLVHRIMEARQLRGIKRRAERGFALAAWDRWGATDEEVARAMPGDDLVPDAVHVTTRAIPVCARPDEIWPWLAQMGKGRGGLYSLDFLDRLLGILDAPSARRILPQWQDLRPGDVIPIGRSPGWPVYAVDAPRSLVLRIKQEGVRVTQSWSLDPVDADTTRLVLRIRAAVPPGLRWRAWRALIAPQEAVMVRAQLRGIRRRAERHRTGPVDGIAPERAPRRTMVRKLLLGCGIASSVLYVLMNVITPLRYPGYSAFSQTISELSAIDAPSRPLWMALGAVYVALLIAFGNGVWLSANGKRALRVVGTLLVGLGVTGLIWPFLPGGASMHRREVLAAGGATLTDTLHLISGGVGTVFCLLIIGFGATAFGRLFRIYSVATIVVLLGFGIWTGLEAPMVSANEPTPWLGVIERIMFASFVLWFAVLSIVLLREERPEEYRGAATARSLTPSVNDRTP